MPDWGRHLRQQLGRFPLAPGRQLEIVEELSQHLEERYEELRASGADEGEAQRLTVQELLEPEALAGYLGALRQAKAPPPITPGAPGRALLADVWQDLRYAWRMLRKLPGFAAAAILTLALGIGANSAIFALVDGVLLRPLPLPDPDRLVMVWERTRTSERSPVSVANLHDWSQRNTTFEGMAAYTPAVGGMVLSGHGGSPDSVSRQWVSAAVFDVLGVRAIVGRTFSPSDLSQRADVVVLNEAFWRARFNADPKVVGSHVHLDGKPHLVAGVVPATAEVLGRSNIWALSYLRFPSVTPPEARDRYGARVIARLKPGVALPAAMADMTAIAEALAREHPASNRDRGVTLQPMHDAVMGPDLRRSSLLFLGVVGFVLLICSANIANLQLTRATARRRELAVRAALGADRGRVIRQLLTESTLISVIGGAFGLLIGAAILEVAPVTVPSELLPATVTLNLDGRVVAFSAATALVVGVLFGLIPAWQAAELSSARVAESGSRAATGRGGGVRDLLVVGQVATAVMLLFGAGLLLRSLLAIDRVDRGYQADSVLSMIIDPGPGYQTPTLLRQFYETVEREVAALPGAQAAGWATTLPLGRSYQGPSRVHIPGQPLGADGQQPRADYQIVSPSYFEAVELQVVAGRSFDGRDTAEGGQVCMVNEAFVRRYLRGRSPIGLRVTVRPPTAPPEAAPVVREIVGVARQVKGQVTETDELVQLYVPLAQDTPGDIFLLVRSEPGRADTLAPSVRRAISRVDKGQLVGVRQMMTLDDVVSLSAARHRFRAVLVMAFAGLALLLAMVGLFGVMAYSVQQRVRDFGVRRVLGATTRDVFSLVAVRAARLMGAGTLIGLVLSALLGRLLVTMLFGVEPLDSITFAFVTLVVAVTAAASTMAPAWHATRIDPGVALRNE